MLVEGRMLSTLVSNLVLTLVSINSIADVCDVNVGLAFVPVAGVNLGVRLFWCDDGVCFGVGEQVHAISIWMKYR